MRIAISYCFFLRLSRVFDSIVLKLFWSLFLIFSSREKIVHDRFHSKFWKIKFHSKIKCFLLLSRSNFQIWPTGTDIESTPLVENMKVLGIFIDSRLVFLPHVSKTNSRASSNLFLLLKLKRLGYRADDFSLPYQSLVLSILTYVLEVWGSAAKTVLRKVDAVQKRAVRMGIIKEFVPIEEHIKVKTARLLNNISKPGSKHQLYDIVPHRRDYWSERLRKRLPTAEVAVKKVYGSMFPDRILRNF